MSPSADCCDPGSRWNCVDDNHQNGMSLSNGVLAKTTCICVGLVNQTRSPHPLTGREKDVCQGHLVVGSMSSGLVNVAIHTVCPRAKPMLVQARDAQRECTVPGA